MPKTKEELNQLKQECEQLSKKLEGLTEDELLEITGSGSIEDYNEKMKHYIDSLINPEYAYRDSLK